MVREIGERNSESDRAKRAHGGVKNEKFAEIVLIYAGSERSELASDSAKLMQFISAVFDAFLRSRPWFCPRKPRACQPVAGVAGCSVASGDLCRRFQAPLCSMMSPFYLAGPLPLRISLHRLLLLLSPASPSCSGPCSHCSLVAQRGEITASKCSRTTSSKRLCVMVPLFAALSALQKRPPSRTRRWRWRAASPPPSASRSPRPAAGSAMARLLLPPAFPSPPPPSTRPRRRRRRKFQPAQMRHQNSSLITNIEIIGLRSPRLARLAL